MKLQHLFYVLAVVLSSLPFVKSQDPLKIKVTEGYVEGKVTAWINPETNVSMKVSSFLGIPYAEPPVGDLRFKKPVPISSWKNTILAHKARPECIHPGGGGEENCLYINIWKPELDQDTPLPILIWIPGGGFLEPLSITEKIAATFVVMTNLILVTFSYRQGPLGFLYTGEEEAMGNMGLYDQLVALKWVQDNMLYFGGDPETISIMGENIGAASANFHLLTSAGRQMFNRAILLSGTAEAKWFYNSPEEAKKMTQQLLNATGCANGGVSCLLKFDPHRLEVLSRPERFSRITSKPFPFVPTIDDVILSAKPSDMLAKNNFKKTSIMIGLNWRDGRSIVEKFIKINPNVTFNRLQEIMTLMDSLLPGESADLIFQLLSNYFGSSTYNIRVDISDISEVLTDALFLCPSIRVADAYSNLQQRVFYYLFDSLEANWPTDGVPYFLLVPFTDHKKYDDKDRKLSKRLAMTVASFVANGDAHPWPPYHASYRLVARFDKGSQGRVHLFKPDQHNCHIWNKVLRQ